MSAVEPTRLIEVPNSLQPIATQITWTMPEEITLQLNLQDLAQGLPAITPAFGAALAEAAAVCLNSQGHVQGILLPITGDLIATCHLSWQPVTPQMLRCWNDQEYTTEQAAYAIALLLMQHLKGFTVVVEFSQPLTWVTQR